MKLNIFIGELIGPNGMALTVYDVALEWNTVIGNKIGYPINMNDIPPSKFSHKFLRIF